jgi:hypothetical protein
MLPESHDVLRMELMFALRKFAMTFIVNVQVTQLTAAKLCSQRMIMNV